MGIWVILAIAVALIFISLLALGCCRVAKNHDEQMIKPRSMLEKLRIDFINQYLTLCQDYGVLAEWTNKDILQFIDDYKFENGIHLMKEPSKANVIVFKLPQGTHRVDAKELRDFFLTLWNEDESEFLTLRSTAPVS